MTIRYPGLIDVHAHLRVPGGEQKEDFSSGSRAAVTGGITMVLAMPNTTPPLTNRTELEKAQKLAKEKALCEVLFFAGVSPETIHQLPAISYQAVALKIYMDHTFGPLLVQNPADLAKCFEKYSPDKPIAVHAEGESVATAIGLADHYQRPVHICHVSRKEEIRMVRNAKDAGIRVTCEVTPHHLFLSNKDLSALGSFGRMRPPLAEEEDVAELWKHIDTTIDCIASDHAPHTVEEKMGENPPAGVPGLETMLPLMLTAVAEGRLTEQRLLELLVTNPRAIYHLPEQPDTWVEVDPGEKWEISNAGLFTKCGWTPFAGRKVQGRVKKVIIKNKSVFEDGAFVA